MKLGLLIFTSWAVLLSSTVQAATVPREFKDEKQTGQSAPVSAATPPPVSQSQGSNVSQATGDVIKPVEQAGYDVTKNTKTKKSEVGWQYAGDKNEDYRKFSGVRYTPLDLAEYILRTRDEEGVALAIEELLREGLINREEAILYLETVKRELQNLKERFEHEEDIKPPKIPHKIPQLRLPSSAYQTQLRTAQAEEKRSSFRHPEPQQQLFRHQEQEEQPLALPVQQQQSPKQTISEQRPAEQRESESRRLQQELPLELEKLVQAKVQQQQKNKTIQKQPIASKNGTQQMTVTEGEVEQQRQQPKADNDDYLLEYLIFQMVKDMFSRSMVRDNASAEQLLSRFASFLESELAGKRFSKETQNKIMDTVSAALVESLRERLYLEN